MSVDPLDAVGQGHAWYGYNLVNREVQRITGPSVDDTQFELNPSIRY